MSLRVLAVTGACAEQAWHRRCLDALAQSGAAVSDAQTDPDVVLYLGDGRPPAAPLPPSRLGAWYLRWNAPLAFWELLHGDDVVEAALERVSGGCIKAGWFETGTGSLNEIRDAVCSEAAQWPAQAVREIMNGMTADDMLAPRVERRGDREPNASERMALRAKLARGSIAQRWRYLFMHEHWNVGIMARPIGEAAFEGIARDVRWLPFPPAGTYAADPFGSSDGRALTICCEEYDYRERVGFLSSTTLQAGERAASWHPVLSAAHHLSYPYLIEHEGRTYMCPESGDAGEVVLYEALDFPQRWQRRATLLANFAARDATIFRHDGRWWLLCTGPRGENRALYAWYADALFGPWQPHGRNPVKIDARSARPAGTPFYRDGALHRPAQDCSRAYGRRVAIMRIETLTPTAFAETFARWLEPDPRGRCPDGLHTLSAAGDVTLIDGKYHRFSPREFARVFVHYATAALRATGLRAKGSQRGRQKAAVRECRA